MKKLTILLAVFIFSMTVLAQTKYDSYGNARFNYTISYPADLLTPQGEADNGDGRIFKGDGAQLTVFGTNLLTNETLLKEFNATIKERGANTVTYKIYRRDYFVISGKADGKIYYQKVIRKPNETYVTFILEYDESKRNVYDKAVTKIAKSFK